jgi:hypothetical protein
MMEYVNKPLVTLGPIKITLLVIVIVALVWYLFLRNK